MSLRLVLALVVSVGTAQAASAADWPQFRGPVGSNLPDAGSLPVVWGNDKNVAWTSKVPGVAWSSPIVQGDRLFVTTATSEKQTKPDLSKFAAPRTPPAGGSAQAGAGNASANRTPPPPAPDAVYRWEVYCLDRLTGNVKWHTVAAEHKPTIPIHPTNSYASETPATDGERLYASFGSAGLYCFDLEGKKLWSRDLGSYEVVGGFGTGSSPVLDGDRLFVQWDNEQHSFLLALDKKTGQELWHADRAEKSGWSTPFVWRTPDRTELVVCGGDRVKSYDPATGKVLWELGGMTGSFRSSPVAGDGLLFIGTGGPVGDRPLVAIRPGASGDITLKPGETSNASVAWSVRLAGVGIASPLYYKGYLYVLEQRGGLLNCYEARTGKAAYRKQRLPQGRSFTSSPWAHDDKVFCLDEEGQTYVLKAGPQFALLGKNTLAGEQFWASPAFGEGVLYVRGVENLYCIK